MVFVDGSGCWEVARELVGISCPLVREGVPVLGSGLDTDAPWRIAGEAALSGVLSAMATSLKESTGSALGAGG